MELIYEYGLFLAKIMTIIVFIAIIIIVISNFTQRKRRRGELQILRLSEQYQEMKEEISIALLNSAQQKLWRKAQKKRLKQKIKAEKLKKKQDNENNDNIKKSRVFVIDFKGSIDAHEVSSLREEVTAILAVVKAQDQVVLRLESPGGVVHGYGLAASQLQRLRDRNIFLTVVIDKIATSGGYMMACVANQIVAAPFSIIGSIGVVAQIPNFNRFLKKKDIDIELHTAGQYKRTLTMLGENTEEGRQKFCKELNETHFLFKNFVKQMRPSLNIDQIATGEHWYGVQALEKGLVDKIKTSDDFLLELLDTKELVGVRFTRRKRLVDRFIGNYIENMKRSLFQT